MFVTKPSIKASECYQDPHSTGEMADSTQGDALVHSLGVLASAIITLVPGLLIHSFIIGVNVNDWWKGRSVTSIDHIVTSLGISRMCTQCAFIIFLFLASFSKSSLPVDVIMLIFPMAYSFFTYSNIWLTSLLSIVFCLKISNLRTRPFLYLRRVILPRTGHFIVASGLLAAVICFMPFWSYINEIINDGPYNTTIDNQPIGDSSIVNVYHFSIGSSIPMIFYVISSVLLFSSLYHHTVKMKMSSNLSINLETYYSAMKFVSFTFIYNIIYFFGMFASVFCYYLYGVRITWGNIIFGCLPVLHSSYLIYRTAKLRSQMSKVLQKVTEFLFPRKSTETRENIEVIAQ
ncbi:taste receptor type 2 member 9-like [Phyllobates terribilis]|uniref:taste receptor type 2 member 9-like n=1 Tax=Phyllobates terribilis TaxID=111132 RepID=UPI003CCB006C